MLTPGLKSAALPLVEGQDRVLLIKAKGGLGNRMLSAITGLVLADLTGRRAFVDWRDGMYVPPGENLYPHLFAADWMGDIAELDAEADVAPAIWSSRLSEHPVDVIRREFPKQHRDPFLYRRLSIPFNGPDPAARAGVFWSYLPKLQRLAGRLAKDPRYAGKSLGAITSDYLARYFQPVAEVTARVDRIFSDVAGPIIGVHIRFTDRKAPLPKILGELERLSKAMPEARVFLATDSEEAQNAVLSRFDNVITIEKALSSSDKALHFSSDHFLDPIEEARNALIDMMALAHCDYLIHSGYSTFSVTAALLGRIPAANQFDVDRFNPKVRIKQYFQARI